MKDKCLIDTSIFIAAYTNAESLEKKEIARDFLIKLHNTNAAYVSVQTLVEYINITKYKLKVSDVDILRKDINNIQNMFNMVSCSSNTIIDALELCFEKNIYFFDALLVQTMLENGIRTIYTENTMDFKKISGIKVINPFNKKMLH